MRWAKICLTCLSLITVPVLIESCCGSGNANTNFNIKGFSIVIHQRGNWGVPPPTSAPLSKYSFEIFGDAEFRRAQSESPHPTMAAYAFRCDDLAPALSDQTISEFVVTSSNKFTLTDASFPAGTDFSEIFAVDSYPDVQNVSELIGLTLWNANISLMSDRVVDVAQRHKLRVFIKLSDGQSFEVVTDEVEFTP